MRILKNHRVQRLVESQRCMWSDIITKKIVTWVKLILIAWLIAMLCSVMSDSLQPHGLKPTRLLCPWDFPGKNIGVGCHFLLQGIFPTQGSNPHPLHLLHWQEYSLPLHHLGSLVLRACILE